MSGAMKDILKLINPGDSLLAVYAALNGVAIAEDDANGPDGEVNEETGDKEASESNIDSLKAEIKRLKFENSQLEDTLNKANQESEILYQRLTRFETQFDERLLPNFLLDASVVPKNYKDAVDKTLYYNRSWFIEVQLSQEGKVAFAQTLLNTLDPILKGQHTDFIKAVATRDTETLEDIWSGVVDEDKDIADAMEFDGS